MWGGIEGNKGTLEMIATDAIRETLGQIIFFSALLCGFSFSGVAQLIGQRNTSRIASWTIAMFLISTITLLVATWAAATTYAGVTLARTMTEQSVWQLYLPLFIILVLVTLGTLSFLAGLGLLGWMYSKGMGIVSTTLASIGLVLITVLFYLLNSLRF